jgi:hypothetical protein
MDIAVDRWIVVEVTKKMNFFLISRHGALNGAVCGNEWQWLGGSGVLG